jgi:hypothetical protein
MSAKPTPAQLEAERRALIGSDALLSDLVRERGEAKICYDEEDGWFLQFLYIPTSKDSWMTLDLDEQRHTSPSEAIRGAVRAHNAEVTMRRAQRRWCNWQIIPDNAEVSRGDGSATPTTQKS